MNLAVDMQCKKALDNIARQARTQGPEAVEFFKEAQADPQKCKEMLESYDKAHKNWTAGKISNIQWSIV